VLVNTEPARTAAVMAAGAHAETAESAGMPDHEPVAATVDLGDMRAVVVVDPAMSGENTIHLTFGPPAAAEKLTEVSVAASLPSQEIGPLDFTAVPVPGAPTTYMIAGASLPIAGEWELRIKALVGKFDLLTETIIVPIGEE